MSFKLHKEPQVESSAQAQLELKIEHARRTMKSPHELIEHVIKLYGAEFEKANDCIAALNKSLQASGKLLEEQKRANDELKQANDVLFSIKQKLVIVNRELVQKNADLEKLVEKASVAIKNLHNESSPP
jgi:glutaredoxin 2